MNVDTATKFVNRKTFLDELEELEYDKGYKHKEIEDMYDSRDNKNPRTTVITSYGNNRSYQIDGISYKMTPNDHIFDFIPKPHVRGRREERKGGEADCKMVVDNTMKGSVKQYFEICYGIKIR